MPARRYTVAGRRFSKVVTSAGKCHVVEEGQFWKGRGGFHHIAVCGEEIGGTPVSLTKVNCQKCRAEITKLRDA